MIRTGTLELARANRRHLHLANGTGYWRSDLIVAGDDRDGHWRPQAFLVEQDADSEILPHFHEENEFQVVVEGDGEFGRHPVRPVMVHYAGRHTGYGPIKSGGRGLWYFSLRAVSDSGARFLPEARKDMEKGSKRQLLGETIEPQPDGIAAWVLRQPMPAPDGAARFYVVLSGDIAWQGSRLPRLAVAFATEAFQFEGDGSVLCVQFPC
jgi:hypothetical protein